MSTTIEHLTTKNVARLALELECYDSGRTSQDVLRGASLDVTDRLDSPRNRVFETDEAQIAFCSLLRQYDLENETAAIYARLAQRQNL
ncbi:TPA: hypothetical protein HA241_07510 [Candidatus Woesearchaeota archaeon]|nr:hypothetical protein [Candidatus Woesearchaeota archaeon]